MSYTVSPLSITTQEFLGAFYAPNETVRIQVYPDRKDESSRVSDRLQYAPKLSDFVSIQPELTAHNKKHRAIAFIVNKGGFTGREITDIKALFVEIDYATYEEQLARIQSFHVEPSVIVRTRRSLHTYWLVNDVTVEEFSGLQKQLVAVFDGDANCVNLNRAMRLPGFYHCKETPIMVECIKFSPSLIYSKNQIVPHLPAATTALSGEREGKPTLIKGLRRVLMGCDFMRHCEQNAASLPEHDWYAMITNLVGFVGGEQAIHDLSKPYPKYTKDETNSKIEHYKQSGTKPMTCALIAEKGFKCPRLLDNSCECKAPAALCYAPADLSTLRALLAEQPVVGKPSDDIQTAIAFVRDYLSNTDNALAITFIENEISQHFRFKVATAKTLLAVQREQAKEAKACEVKQTDIPIPLWYHPTDRGGLKFLPDVLADHMSKNVYAFHSAGAFFGYEDGVYKMRDDIWALAKVKEFTLLGYTTLSAATDTLGQWRAVIQRNVVELNASPLIINVRNGLYSVNDDVFSGHTPEFLSTMQINAAYTIGAECPQFLMFMRSMLAEPEINVMQEIMGYLLVPINKAQKAFIFVGAPNAGKSTLLSIIQEVLLGSDNVSNVAWQNLSDRFNKAELFGKLANLFADLPNKSLDDGGVFKALTGEDFITAERKHAHPFSFRSFARLLFSCNEIPRNYGDRTEGFYRRLLILRFDKSVPMEQRDPNLRERLASEGSGIFMWALEGLKRLICNSYQFSETEATKNELQRYRVDCNSVLLFIEECCSLDINAEVFREEVFNAYREYCKRNGLMPLSQTRFNKDVELSDVHIKRGRDRIGRQHTWQGIKLEKS